MMSDDFSQTSITDIIMNNKITTIGRDTFARHDFIRQEEEILDGGCDWCGQLSRLGKLFQYGHSPDDSGRANWHNGKFCSKGCYNSYK